jgi:hypothetical protein
MAAGTNMPKDGVVADGEADALTLFNAQLLGKTRFTLTNVTAKVERKKGAINATVEFTAEVPVAVLGIFGKSSVQVSGVSKASNTLALYIDFYLLLDNTPSMGVGATTTDINKMVANTSDKCAFACHDLSDSNNYYNLAKKLGVAMRIDVVRAATQQLMDTASGTEHLPNQFRAAIYTFGTSCTSLGLTTISSLTSNLSSAKSAASKIDLMSIPYQNYNKDQCTDFDTTIAALDKIIGNSGSGASSSQPQKILFFVSDGLNDANKPGSCAKPITSGTRCQEPLPVALCTAIKKRGVKIAVLYTTYLPLPTNAWYNSWIKPFATEMAPTMEACATPGLYFEVSPTQGITEAMNALFQKAVAQARLTF